MDIVTTTFGEKMIQASVVIHIRAIKETTEEASGLMEKAIQTIRDNLPKEIEFFVDYVYAINHDIDPGPLDEVTVYDQPLTDEELAELKIK